MYYSERANRPKRWYRPLTIGQRKLLVLAAVMFLLILAFVGVVAFYTYRAHKYDLNLVTYGMGESQLYDAENRPVGVLSASGNNYAGWDSLPEHLVNAFVAREDENFFEHSGIVYSSVLRSLVRNVLSMKYEQGASTITMQLTRNVFELREKTLDRKMLEAVLAQRIEKHYNKATIFTQYVNRIYYGESCYGISRAARYYFGKNVNELNLVECATLVGLVRAPSLCNPCNSMENAMGVKRETLARMLELDFISQEQHDAAVAAPIELVARSVDDTPGSSYAVLWTNHELESLREKLGDNTGGMAVGSNLDLAVQQYAEVALERALQAVERRGTFPAEWEPQLSRNAEEAEAQKKSFMEAKRPTTLKVRMQDNNLKGLLQCCVLVVDARRNRRGKVLAVIGGRSAADGIDRWQGILRPGRAAAPLVFCCACLPGGDEHHIVARSAEVTGLRLGYDVVRSFMDSLKLDVEYPARAQESDLYNGLYDMKRLDLARLLFILNNQGRGYRLSLVNTIWSSGRQVIYTYEPDKAPEYIRRESATTVCQLSPFIVEEGKPTMLNETLPEGMGQFSMVCRSGGICTIVWMGLDDAKAPEATSRELRRLLSRASLYLAREIYGKTHEIFDAARKEKKQKEEAARKQQTAAAS